MTAGVLGAADWAGSGWATLWYWVQTCSWGIYAGGAFAMETIWRGTQSSLPQSQIAVACNWMGHRYRWIAAMALAGAAVGALGLRLSASAGSPSAQLALWGCWAFLVVVLGAVTFVGHPALHVRMSAEMPEQERVAARAKVARAIHHMDILLRVDLAGAALALVALSCQAST